MMKKKLFWVPTNDARKNVVAYDWPVQDDRKEAELVSKRIHSICVPIGLVQKLVKMVALHDGWTIKAMVLSPGYDDDAPYIKAVLKAAKTNRGYYIELLDLLEQLDYSLAVVRFSIADQNGNYLQIYQNGVVIGTKDPSEILNAVMQTAQNY